MKIQRQITSILSTMLIASTFFRVPLLAQQSSPQPSAQQPPETAQQPQTQAQPSQPPAGTQSVPSTEQPPAPAPGSQANPQQPANPGTSVNPSQAPLQPVTTYPDATGTQQQPSSAASPQTSIPEGPQPKKQPSEPVGAATAESVPTAGGAAAKPAGVAIAPAKQHQTRSLLIKIGAVVAAGAALGAVVALSRGTSSTPPGTGAAGAVPR
jgi:hypothetical protein